MRPRGWLVFLGHALLEALDALGDVAHQVGEAPPAEQKQDDDSQTISECESESAHHRNSPNAALEIQALFGSQLSSSTS